MKHLATSIFFCILLVILGIAFLYGVLVPQNGQNKPVVNMQLVVFENGLALYQQNKPYYYTFSPYNDYFFSGEGIRSSLITTQDLAEQNFSSSFKTFHLTAIRNTLFGFFNLVSPNITYETKNYQIRYESKFINNSVTINRKIKVKNGKIPSILGETLTFSGADFIYDRSGNLYNFKTDEDLNSFEKFYGIHLQYQSDRSRVSVGDKTIFIMNPLIAAVLVIKADNNQSLYINPDSRTIEIQGTANWQGNENISSMTVSVYDDPKEAQQSL